MHITQISKSNKLHWEGILFLALYIAMPSYFAIEFSNSIPLLTVSRLLLIVLGVGMLLRRRDAFSLKNFHFGKLNLQLTQDKPLCICLFVYFGLLLIANMAYLTKTSEAIKQIFVVVAEEFALVWILSMLLDTRKKIIDALKILLIASGVMGILAAISVIANYNVFYFLNTTAREGLVLRPFYRYGLLRAACGFHHAVYYSSFCAVMLPIAMYLVENTERKRERKLYALCTALTVVGIVLANSRGSQLAFICVAGLIFLIRMVRKDLRSLFRTYLPILIAAFLIVAIVFCLSPAGRWRISSIIKESIPELPEQILPEDTNEIDMSFGENPDGLRSRLIQFTGIVYAMGINPIFGLGANAHAHGLVGYMYAPEKWAFLKTVDVNIVAIMCQYGIVGLLGFLSLYGSIGITFLRKKHRKDPLMHTLFMSFLCYMLCLLSISFLDKWFWVFTGITIALINVIRKEESTT